MGEQFSIGWDGRVNRSTVLLATWAGVIVMAGILPLSNFVAHPHWDAIQWTITSRHWRSIRFYIDVIANIVLFYPLGLLLARPSPVFQWKTFLALAGVGLAFSLGIELFQVFCHNRHPSVVDLMSNTLGTVLGLRTASSVFSLRLLRTWAPAAHSHPTGS